VIVQRAPKGCTPRRGIVQRAPKGCTPRRGAAYAAGTKGLRPLDTHAPLGLIRCGGMGACRPLLPC